jgi:ABC-2 type transport system permease protein
MSSPEFKAHPLVELTKARLREFLRERGVLFWVFGFPILMAMGLGLAFRNKPADVPRIAVVIGDSATGGSPTGGTATTQQALLTSQQVHVETASSHEAMQRLARGKVDLVAEQTPSGWNLRFDPTAERAPLARAVVDDVLQRAAGRADVVSVRDEAITEPGARYIDFLLPGLIGMNLMGSSMWGVGYNLVVARKRRLLRRYAITPMLRSHFLMSYFLARCALLVVEMVVLVTFGIVAFGTVPSGSYVNLAIVAFLGAAAFAAISLIIGARVGNTESANGWMNFVQLPQWILGGAFFSSERFPDWLHAVSRWLPLTALNDALRGVYRDGASLFLLSHELLVLIAWTVLGFWIAARRFVWQ